MKYAHAENSFDEGGNTARKEQARISAWHATFNAALTGMLGHYDNNDAWKYATKLTNDIHGEL
jgi:hypothetical protein